MRDIPLFVDGEWLERRLDDPDLRLLDATTYLKPTEKPEPELWSGAGTYHEGHIPGAVFADLLHDLSAPDAPIRFTLPTRDAFISKMEELGIGDPDTYVVVYDQGYATVGSPIIASDWASRLAWQLQYEGHKQVSILDGGFAKWQEEKRPVSTAIKSYPKATFHGERQPQLLATKEDVKKAINDDETILLNSLSANEFSSARIPGSSNVPFGVHADTQTKTIFRDEKLKQNFEKSGALDPNKKVIAYCGGGIAATWNALLLQKLGQRNVAVYDGSMAEWTADASLPLEADKPD